MLNVGPLELLVVLAVALVVVGPERLPELARSVGRVLRQFREVQDDVRDMVSSGVDDDMREAASEFRKATGSIKRATDVKGVVRRAERSIREQTASSPGPGGTPASSDVGEAEGPPADRLVEDASAGGPTSVQPVPPAEPVELADHADPADDTEPESPSVP
ncbi:MAG: twin-arginine translocase TatA/TatE family subunit [Actinomycetota bacterium]|nr:twin-arginine translocase TatA/TatE family subunit [Actinomycetota bacterium]